MEKQKWFGLQLFAEGGEGSPSAGTENGTSLAGATSEDAAPIYRAKKKNPLADVKYGLQKQEPAPQQSMETVTQQDAAADASQTEERPTEETKKNQEMDFHSLVGKGGKYEKEYNKSVQAIVQSRLKNTKQTEATLQKIAPLLITLGERYGIDANDLATFDADALAQKIEEDISLYEEEAEKEGLPVETVAKIKKLERAEKAAQMREAADAERERQQAEEEKQREYWSSLLAQGEELKKIYPTFDFDAEMRNNSRFRGFMNIRNPITNQCAMSVREAYQLCHQDDILSGAMQYAVQTAQQKITNSIQSGKQRPIENGGNASVDIRNDPSKLTKADFDEILRRKRSGETIVF